MAAVLSALPTRELCGFCRVRVLKARARLVAHISARLYEDMAAVGDSYEEEVAPWAPEAIEYEADEIRAALCLTRRAADAELAFARDLRERLPRVWKALDRGAIDVRRARVLVDGTRHLPVEEAREVIARVLPHAGGLTTGELRARLRRLCVEVDPKEAETRYRVGLEDRRVVVEENPDGTANLLALNLEPHVVMAARRRIEKFARAAKTADDPRTLDQVRADVLADLLTGYGSGHRASDGGSVHITVDLTTLTGLADDPGELEGWGPVIADVARRIAAAQIRSPWRVTVLDGGQPVWTGVTRRRPTAALRRAVTARLGRCVFPGCRMPAVDCDLDHTRPWAQGGPTAVGNLEPGCRHDHNLKHRAGWRLQLDPDGSYTWTSPLGHTYTVRCRGP